MKLSALLPAGYSVTTAAQTADVPLSLPEQHPVQIAHLSKTQNSTIHSPKADVFVPAIEEPSAIIAMYSQQWDIPELLNPLTLAEIKPTPVFIPKHWILSKPAITPVRSVPFYQLGSSF